MGYLTENIECVSIDQYILKISSIAQNPGKKLDNRISRITAAEMRYVRKSIPKTRRDRARNAQIRNSNKCN